MYPNKKSGYTLQGNREARYIAAGARLLNEGQGLEQAIEDSQTLVRTRAYCRVLESEDSGATNEWMASQANKAVKVAEIALPAELNESIIQSLGHITALSFVQATRLGVRRSVARDMLATMTPPVDPLPSVEIQAARHERMPVQHHQS